MKNQTQNATQPQLQLHITAAIYRKSEEKKLYY